MGKNVYTPTTVGSRSTKTARGTCLPDPVSLKNVLKESSVPPMVLSLGIWPSGWMPCSRQYSSQQALPIWTPACPTWIEIHSRWNENHHNDIDRLYRRTIQGISLDTLCWRSDVTLRGSRASYQPRSKLNVGENMAAARPGSGVIHEPRSVTSSDLHHHWVCLFRTYPDLDHQTVCTV